MHETYPADPTLLPPSAAAWNGSETHSSAGLFPVSSRSVDFSSVCEWVAPRMDSVEDWPGLGTAEWRSLPADDPRRWAAVLDAARHWALVLERNQTAMAEASRAVSAAADWGKIARRNNAINSFRANHSWARRVVAS